MSVSNTAHSFSRGNSMVPYSKKLAVAAAIAVAVAAAIVAAESTPKCGEGDVAGSIVCTY